MRIRLGLSGPVLELKWSPLVLCTGALPAPSRPQGFDEAAASLTAHVCSSWHHRTTHLVCFSPTLEGREAGPEKAHMRLNRQSRRRLVIVSYSRRSCRTLGRWNPRRSSWPISSPARPPWAPPGSWCGLALTTATGFRPSLPLACDEIWDYASSRSSVLGPAWGALGRTDSSRFVSGLRRRPPIAPSRPSLFSRPAATAHSSPARARRAEARRAVSPPTGRRSRLPPRSPSLTPPRPAAPPARPRRHRLPRRRLPPLAPQGRLLPLRAQAPRRRRDPRAVRGPRLLLPPGRQPRPGADTQRAGGAPLACLAPAPRPLLLRGCRPLGRRPHAASFER